MDAGGTSGTARTARASCRTVDALNQGGVEVLIGAALTFVLVPTPASMEEIIETGSTSD